MSADKWTDGQDGSTAVWKRRTALETSGNIIDFIIETLLIKLNRTRGFALKKQKYRNKGSVPEKLLGKSDPISWELSREGAEAHKTESKHTECP